MPNYLNTDGLKKVWGRIKELVSKSCKEVSDTSSKQLNSSVNTLQGKINDQKLIKLKYSNNVLVMYDPAQDSFVNFSWKKVSDYINSGRVIQLSYGNKQYYLSGINNTMMTFINNSRNGNQGQLFILQFLKQEDSYKVLTDSSVTFYNTDYIDEIKKYAEGHAYSLCKITKEGTTYNLPISYSDFSKLAENNAIALEYLGEVYYQFESGIFTNFAVSTGDIYNILAKQFVVTSDSITYSEKSYGSNDFILGQIVSDNTIEVAPPTEEGTVLQPRRIQVQKGKLYISGDCLFRGTENSFDPVYSQQNIVEVDLNGTFQRSSVSDLDKLWKLMQEDRVVVKTSDGSVYFRLAGFYNNSANYTCLINGESAEAFSLLSLVFTYKDGTISTKFTIKDV